MNQRRGFIGAAAGFVAGLFGARPAQAAASAWPEDRVCVFRLRLVTNEHGTDYQWRRCLPQDIRRGDWLMLIGLSEVGGDLWRCDTWQASDDWRPCPDGRTYGQNRPVRGSTVADFLETATVRARTSASLAVMDRVAGSV